MGTHPIVTIKYYHVGNGCWDWFVDGMLVNRHRTTGPGSDEIYRQILTMYPNARLA